jgi:hypothetical protein
MLIEVVVGVFISSLTTWHWILTTLIPHSSLDHCNLDHWSPPWPLWHLTLNVDHSSLDHLTIDHTLTMCDTECWPLTDHFNEHHSSLFDYWTLTTYIFCTKHLTNWHCMFRPLTDHFAIWSVVVNSQIVKWWLRWSMISGQIQCVNWPSEQEKLTSETL